jgi:hypothetical protein
VTLVRRILAPTLVLSLLASTAMARAEQKLKNEDCLTCHSDKTLTDGDNGKTVSLYVDGAKLSHSIHGAMFTCVDCHKDVKELGHATPPKKIACADCHSDAQQA